MTSISTKKPISIIFSMFCLVIIIFSFSSISIAYSAQTSEKSITTVGNISYGNQNNSPDETPYYIGLSSFPRQQSGVSSPYATSSIDEVINVMDQEGLNIWRMTFSQDDSRFPPSLQDEFIQYYLDHCDYDLILCYTLNFGYLSDADWLQSKTRGLEILSTFSAYQDRIWMEVCNEARDTDIATQVQTIVTAFRDAGYTANIIADVFWHSNRLLTMSSVVDPLDKFYTGQHIYFYDAQDPVWSVSTAESWMQEGLDAGLKIINTEIGADCDGQVYFTETGVNKINEFMDWCATRGIGNTVWVLYGDYDYPRYSELGLEFP